MKNGWKINGEADLATDPWTRYVFTSEEGECEAEAITNRVLAPN